MSSYTPPPLSENRITKILSGAKAGNYAVLATCCYNLESILASLRAAEALSSPIIIQLFPWALTYANSSLVVAAATAIRESSIPAALHLDHAQTPELVKRAADIASKNNGLGFDGIMCDMSHYEKEENLQLTKELVAYCHERGIVTEAEPGRIEGGEDGVAETVDLEAVLTTPDQAEEFVATGIECLAPAFGNVHGEYGPRGIQLEYERLQSINDAVGDRVMLVLHGADPFTDEIFSKCIKAGVVKINVNKGVNNAYAKVQKEMEGKALTSVIEAGTDAMQKSCEQYIKWFGSEGKA